MEDRDLEELTFTLDDVPPLFHPTEVAAAAAVADATTFVDAADGDSSTESPTGDAGTATPVCGTFTPAGGTFASAPPSDAVPPSDAEVKATIVKRAFATTYATIAEKIAPPPVPFNVENPPLSCIAWGGRHYVRMSHVTDYTRIKFDRNADPGFAAAAAECPTRGYVELGAICAMLERVGFKSSFREDVQRAVAHVFIPYRLPPSGGGGGGTSGGGAGAERDAVPTSTVLAAHVWRALGMDKPEVHPWTLWTAHLPEWSPALAQAVLDWFAPVVRRPWLVEAVDLANHQRLVPVIDPAEQEGHINGWNLCDRHIEGMTYAWLYPDSPNGPVAVRLTYRGARGWLLWRDDLDRCRLTCTTCGDVGTEGLVGAMGAHAITLPPADRLQPLGKVCYASGTRLTKSNKPPAVRNLASPGSYVVWPLCAMGPPYMLHKKVLRAPNWEVAKRHAYNGMFTNARGYVFGASGVKFLSAPAVRARRNEKGAAADEDEDEAVETDEEEEAAPAPPRRKRGRPRKNPAVLPPPPLEEEEEEAEEEEPAEEKTIPVKPVRNGKHGKKGKAPVARKGAGDVRKGAGGARKGAGATRKDADDDDSTDAAPPPKAAAKKRPRQTLSTEDLSAGKTACVECTHTLVNGHTWRYIMVTPAMDQAAVEAAALSMRNDAAFTSVSSPISIELWRSLCHMHGPASGQIMSLKGLRRMCNAFLSQFKCLHYVPM